MAKPKTLPEALNVEKQSAPVRAVYVQAKVLRAVKTASSNVTRRIQSEVDGYAVRSLHQDGNVITLRIGDLRLRVIVEVSGNAQ